MKKQTRNLIIIGSVVVVLVGALLAVLFLVPNKSEKDGASSSQGSTYPTDKNGKEYAVDEVGNRIEAETTSDGKIVSAGVVALTNKVPADLKEIHIINPVGDFTVKAETKIKATSATTATEATDGSDTTALDPTVYTLVGYEKLTLDGTAMSSIGNDAAAIKSTKIVDINGKSPEKYGLNEPRATVNVSYIDGSKATIKIGNEVPAVGAGTYVMINDEKSIYLVANESIDSFFYNPAQMMSKNITTAAESDDDTSFTSIVLGGSHLEKEITIVPNDDETNGAYYKITAPIKSPVSVEEGSSIVGCIRGLMADAVIAVNPTDKQLEKFGLQKPYATIKGVYSDANYTLKSSKPDKDGNVNLMCNDVKLVYKIAASKITWVNTTLTKLQYEYVLKPKLEKISSIDVTIADKKYTFKTTTATTKDDKGTETTKTTAIYKDKELNSSYFDTYFANLTSATIGGTEKQTEKSELLKITYNFNNGKEADTVAFYKTDTTKVMAKVNGQDLGFVYETYTNQVISDTVKIAENKRIDAVGI